MSEAKAPPRTPSLEELAREVQRLRERVEDLEDARELDAAIRRNAAKPLIPWDQAKKDLGLAGGFGGRSPAGKPTGGERSGAARDASQR